MNQRHLLSLSTILTVTMATVFITRPFPSIRPGAMTDLQNDGTTSLLYVVVRGGTIVVFNSTNPTSTSTFLDITTKVVSGGGEQGLLGLAFHPNYATNKYLYVYYTNPGTVVARYTATTTLTADPNSEVILLQFNQPYENHNGGQITFGNDGYLYVGTGDGGSGNDPQNNGQNTQTFLGKMLRIDVNTATRGNYGIPPTNPFVNNAAYLPEIWAYGLRNPWRFSFDRVNGDMWIGDVGQGAWEEISVGVSGGNFGWKVMEGNHCLTGTNCDRTGKILPVYEYPHAAGDNCIIGGFVYRGSAAPELRGKYLFADNGSGRVWALSFSQTNYSSNSVELLSQSGYGVTSFGVDKNGEVYFLALNTNTIHGFSSNGTIPTSSPTLGPTSSPTMDATSEGDSEAISSSMILELSLFALSAALLAM